MSESLLQIGKELPHYSAVNNLPSSYKGLTALASALSKQSEDTKQEILDEVATAAEDKGKPLTEAEIKAI